MSDLSLAISPTDVAHVDPHVDREGKLPRALEALGPVAGRDVVLVDAGLGLRARDLAGIGGRVIALERAGDPIRGLETALAVAAPDMAIRTATGEPGALGLPGASADVVIAGYSAYRGVEAAELAETDRVLRPGGRLLIVHDYGRDDVARIVGPDRPEYSSWGRRDGPFLQAGFRIRVLHCWWTFGSLDEAVDLLGGLFGAPGRTLAADLRRPRISHNLAIYHRTSPGP